MGKPGAAGGWAPEAKRGRGWIALALAVAIAVLVVFALDQAGGSGGGALSAIARAAEATQREAGGHAFIHASVTMADSPEGVTEDGSIVFDNGGRARGTLVLRGHSTGRRAKVRVITDGATSYASSDQLDSRSEGRKWVKIDFPSATSSAPLAADGGPEEGLKLLERMDGAEEIGREDIRGVATTHYRGTLPVSEKEVFGVEVQVSPPRVEVWIDARGRVRRMTVVVSSSPGGEKATTEIAMDLFGFGTVPKIELPEQDEIYDATGRVESEFKAAAQAP